MNDAATIKQRLLSQLESVLSFLLPSGHIHGHEFRVGGLNNEPGKSMSVQLAGERRGVWKDFASDECGDIFALWMGAKNMTFKEVIADASRFLGITNIEPPKAKPMPPPPDTSGLGAMRGSPVLEYLNSRGISDATMKLYRVRSHARCSEHNTAFIGFTFFTPDGQPVMLKSTGIAKKADGTKDIWSTKPWYTLWGWWLVDANTRSIAITEGEIDAMSLHQLKPGVPVLSLPAGASNLDFIDNDFETLQRFERIYIVTDMDEAGEKAAKTMAKRLGLARCIRVPIPKPFKDTNEALTKAEPDLLEWSAWMEGAFSYDPKTLCGPASLKAECMALLSRERNDREKSTFLWPKIPFQFRDGEMTLLTGFPGGGKSGFAYQTHLHEMENGKKCLFASFEIPPEKMLLEMATMRCHHVPTEEEFSACLDWFAGRLWFYRPPEVVVFENVLADMSYAFDRFGVTRFIVDSLHFLADKEDYEKQDIVSKNLYKFAVANSCHVGLVAHSSTKKDSDKVPGMGDVEGSGGVCKPADNGITIWRNVGKAEKIEKAREEGDDAAIKKAEKLHDGIMACWKQRGSGKLFREKFWFDATSKRFRLTPDAEPAIDPSKLSVDENASLF